MQHKDQEMRLSDNPMAQQKKNIRYLNRMRISKDEHTLRIGPRHEALQGKTNKEIVLIKNSLQKRTQPLRGNLHRKHIVNFQDRRCVMAPYNFAYVYLCLVFVNKL